MAPLCLDAPSRREQALLVGRRGRDRYNASLMMEWISQPLRQYLARCQLNESTSIAQGDSSTPIRASCHLVPTDPLPTPDTSGARITSVELAISPPTSLAGSSTASVSCNGTLCYTPSIPAAVQSTAVVQQALEAAFIRVHLAESSFHVFSNVSQDAERVVPHLRPWVAANSALGLLQLKSTSEK